MADMKDYNFFYIILGYSYDYPPQSYPLSERSTYRPYKTDKTSVASKYAGVITPRRRPGRPRIKSLPTDEEKRLREEKRCKHVNNSKKKKERKKEKKEKVEETKNSLIQNFSITKHH